MVVEKSTSIECQPELRVKGLFLLADSFNVRSSREHLFRVLSEIRTHRHVVPEGKFRRMLDMIGNSLDVSFEHVKNDYDLLPEDTHERHDGWGDNNEGEYWEKYLAIVRGQVDPRVLFLN